MLRQPVGEGPGDCGGRWKIVRGARGAKCGLESGECAPSRAVACRPNKHTEGSTVDGLYNVNITPNTLSCLYNLYRLFNSGQSNEIYFLQDMFHCLIG